MKYNSLFNSNGQYLYHYTSFEVAVENILDTGKVRFSPFIKTNDPLENKSWLLDWSANLGVQNPNFEMITQRRELINEFLSENCKTLCFTKEFYDSNNQLVEGFEHPRMWAQYGNNHKGVSLVFDKDLMDKAIKTQLGENKKLFSGEVFYTEDFHNFTTLLGKFNINFSGMSEEDLISYVYNSIPEVKDIFMMKRRDWESESEFRYVIADKDKGFLTFDFKDSLKYIVLGSEINLKIYYPVLKLFMDKYKIRIGRMSWQNGLPYLRHISE